MSHAYRSAYQQMIGMRLAEMKVAREMVEPLLPRLRSVRAARTARALAGAVGIAGAFAMPVFAVTGDEAAPTYALLGAAGAALGTYAVARALFGLAGSFVRRTLRMPALTGDLEADLARLDASDPRRAIDRTVDSLEVWSTALPLGALSLLTPLMLHYAFVCVGGSETAAGFGRWIRLSLVIVGHAHLALMALAIRFARKMQRADAEDLAQMSIHREWLVAWLVTVVVSAVPGVLLLAVPPILTTITGLAFIPFMFALMRRVVINERSALELADEAVNVRIAPDAAVAAAALEHVGSDELLLRDFDDQIDVARARV